MLLLVCSSGGFSVFAGVGERTREGNDLYREMIESGVIKLDEKQVSNSAMLILDVFCYPVWYYLFTEVLLSYLFRLRANVLLSMVK